MIVAVLDTNVLASGFFGLNKLESTPGELLRRWRDIAFTLVVSEAILAELARVFRTPWFTHRLSTAEIASAFSQLQAGAVNQPITVSVSGIATHSADDLILATALSAGAEYLVTGDKGLRQLGDNGGTRLLIPREFVDVLDRASAG